MAGMEGKLCVITGATSGIGLITAERLAAMGARLVLVGRDRARGEAALARIKALAPRAEVSMHYADLARLDALRTLAAGLAALSRIDVLINNAGAMFAARELTPDGLERTFALNHLAYFVVTQGLAERLAATRGARIVNTASDAHRGATLELDDLQSVRGYGPMQAYGRSKLCNILFTRELARRLQGTGVTANSLHPGFVATRFGDQSGGLISGVFWLAKFFAISPAEGAKTIVHLAASPDLEGVSGKYFYRCRETSPTPAAQDDRAGLALWERSAQVAGVQA